MPRMMGIEMIEKVYELGLEPRVIFLTAYDDFAYAQQAVKLGAADYLLKPFKDGELESTIQKLIEKNRRDTERKEQHNQELRLDAGDKSKYIMDAIAYVDENYANPNISVRAVADHLGISEGHLSHLFRKETDSTLMAFVTKRRMRAAMSMLQDYRHKVYEVAEMVGYRDVTYFGSTFKKLVGMSPPSTRIAAGDCVFHTKTTDAFRRLWFFDRIRRRIAVLPGFLPGPVPDILLPREYQKHRFTF